MLTIEYYESIPEKNTLPTYNHFKYPHATGTVQTDAACTGKTDNGQKRYFDQTR
jgi:hypothetical protein